MTLTLLTYPVAAQFLVGTKPINEKVYSTIAMYKELEANKALTRGPLDLQHANYRKSLRSASAKSAREGRDVVNAMRSVLSPDQP